MRNLRLPLRLRADLPPALNEIILMAMAKDPAEQFSNRERFPQRTEERAGEKSAELRNHRYADSQDSDARIQR